MFGFVLGMATASALSCDGGGTTPPPPPPSIKDRKSGRGVDYNMSIFNIFGPPPPPPSIQDSYFCLSDEGRGCQIR